MYSKDHEAVDFYRRQKIVDQVTQKNLCADTVIRTQRSQPYPLHCWSMRKRIQQHPPPSPLGVVEAVSTVVAQQTVDRGWTFCCDRRSHDRRRYSSSMSRCSQRRASGVIDWLMGFVFLPITVLCARATGCSQVDVMAACKTWWFMLRGCLRWCYAGGRL